MLLRSHPLTALVTGLAVVVAAVVAVLTVAERADASGTVTVQVLGKGDVTGPGITCSETSGSDCSEFYANEPSDCGDPPCPLLPPDVELVAGPDRNGYTFQSFTGCGSTAGRTCTVTVNSAKNVTASFADVGDPVVSLTSPSAGAVAAGTVQVAATASDNVGVARVDFYVNGTQLATAISQPYSRTIDVSTLNGTSVQVGARATDTSGRQSAMSSVAITVDNTAPLVSVSGPDGGTYGPGSTLSWTLGVTDPLSGTKSVECSLVPSASTPAFGACSGGSSGHTVSGLAEGSFTFTARATDNASNVATVSRTFTVDATPPDTTFTSGPPDGALVSTRSVTFGVGAGEPGSTTGCRLYRSGTTAPAFAPCTTTGTFSTSGLDDGSYVVEARATDAAGNTDASPARRVFTVDGTAPTVGFTKQPKRTVKTVKKKVKVVFGFVSNDPGATFRCSLDGAAPTACSAVTSVKVKAGKHTLSVVAVDAAGNVSATLATSWKVKRVLRRR